MRRADRLIKILHFMRGRRLAVTAQMIAEEFEICTRTVYRDIQDLMDSGAPIRSETGVGYVIDKAYYLPPVAFDIDELEAINLGLSVVQQWTDDRFAQKAEAAFDKIRAVLPTELQGEMDQITTYARPGASLVPWTVSFSDLREAVRGGRYVYIRYLDLRDQETLRKLRPLALIFLSPVWVLASWCEMRRDFRNFRLDRIQDLDVCEGQFEEDPARNLAAYSAQDGQC